MFTIAFILSIITLVISVPIFLVFGLGSSIAAIGGLNLPWSVLIQVSFGALTKHVLIAVPLFIFAGMAMLKGGAASRLVKFTTSLVGHWPGGLGVAMVIAMGFFAAFCGSILAAITAVGTIMMPKMIEQGYPKPFVVVLAASAALLEALIPPSNAAILFSALTNVPVSKTFAAGVIPGLILLVLMVLLVLFKCRHIKTSSAASYKERAKSFIFALPALITPVIILGGIYAGIFTPTEAASVAVVYALIIGGLVYRELKWINIVDCLKITAMISGAVLIIVGPAKAYGELMSLMSVPDMLGEALMGVTESPFLILMIMAIILIISGMFLESIAQIILLTPLMLPIVVGLDVDPIVFGILMVISCEIGFLTPPVGVNLFVAARITNLGVDRISIAVIPFLFAYVLVLVIISAFPDIVTFLPNFFYGEYG